MKTKFKVGDFVAVLDDTIKGKIVSIGKNEIIIATEDGFELSFFKEELVPDILENNSLSNKFSMDKISQVIAQKEIHEKIKKRRQLPKKEKNVPPFEVDLHIHQLTNLTKGMSNFDMLNLQLDTAKQQLEFAIKKRITKVVFIHGVGQGVLKQELETLFNKYDNVTYYDASYKKYGLGATEIYIHQNAKV